MSYPYIFSATFDNGANGEWDSEADTGSLLDFPHFTTLATLSGHPTPYRGAYVMRITPGDTNDHTVTEGDINIGDGSTGWVRFALYVSPNFAATSNDIFNLFEFQQTGGTVEACLSAQITASTDVVDLGIADGTESSAFQATGISKGVWHVIELMLTVSTSDAGVFDMYLDGHRVANLTSLDHAAAVGTGVLGTQNTLTTTSTGYLLFDAFAFDNLRVGVVDRFATNRLVTSAVAENIFVGPGRVDNVKILDGGTGDVEIELFDADVYHASLEPVWRGRTIVASTDVDAADVPVRFHRGCYVRVVGGTLPGVMVRIGRASNYSEGTMKSYVSRRSASLITP
ncbi:hypothetical protein CMI37_07285 [Candidatus Pacearchaeota archaeon]|nr:hypothetical protein [Candidatus Pacearchaeota archaeon]|tara:strand:+ start:898 stop:1920 length:1023 start_codon:yes stop_codon:yes gene_type:complete